MTSKEPTKFTETSVEDHFFKLDFEKLCQAGGDPAVIVALYPMLTSARGADQIAAEMFVRQHCGLGDPSNPDDVAENARYLTEACQLVAARGYDPTPAKIRAEYTPSDAALNKVLDAAGSAGQTPTYKLSPAAHPDNPLHPAAAHLRPGRKRQGQVYSLANDGSGKYGASRTIDL